MMARIQLSPYCIWDRPTGLEPLKLQTNSADTEASIRIQIEVLTKQLKNKVQLLAAFDELLFLKLGGSAGRARLWGIYLNKLVRDLALHNAIDPTQEALVNAPPPTAEPD